MRASVPQYQSEEVRLWHDFDISQSWLAILKGRQLFYQPVFDLKRVGQEELEFAAAIYLSDGVINLALLKYKCERGSGLSNASTFVGSHHFGFQVDNLGESQKKFEAAGGTFFFDLGDNAEKENFERKFKDPDGIIFDISQKVWVGTN